MSRAGVIVALLSGAVCAQTHTEPPLPLGLGVAPVMAEPALPSGLKGAREPDLPFGLATRLSEPALPSGLEGASNKEPSLPAGLGAPSDENVVEAEARQWRMPAGLSGFMEARGGVRTQRDSHEKRATLGETRLQLNYDRGLEWGGVKVVSDFLYDPVLNKHDIDLERGRGFMDLRQANLLLRPLDFTDVVIGRQIMTWGTGDMLFINDLFPKDWNSYFIGRDDEYLKAPSDALKVSLFNPVLNLDLIYTPRFDSDRFIDGRRISYWNSGLGRRTGRDAKVYVERPDDTFRDDEWAARLYRNISTYEVAFYGYDGFWKSPGGQNPETGRAIFPKLQVYGGSARGPLGKGIANLESGWYRSRDDLHGGNPMVNNSELRYLAGYEQELARDLTGGVQYYVEQMLDYGSYRRSLPRGMHARDEYRHVVTLRLTQLLMSQNLNLGAFVYWSPSDHDTYLRPKASYKIDDHWVAEIGANVFVGRDDHTFFGQFERNNNLYVSLRYGF